METKREWWRKWLTMAAGMALCVMACIPAVRVHAASNPTISSISPAAGSYIGGNTVVITGTNFQNTPTVTFAGVPSSSVTFVSATTIQAVVPVYSNTSNRVDVVLTNPDTGTVTRSGGYYYQASTMSITAAAPRIGPANTTSSVTLTGTNLYARYQNQLQIYNPDTVAATNYQYSYIFDTNALIAAGKMRSDCGDIRIRASDNQTLLPYWVETATCNTTTTRVWFKIPTVPAGSYYGAFLIHGQLNATSQEAPGQVFDFFDDFNTADSGKWNYPSSWSVSGGKAVATDNTPITTNAGFNLVPPSAARGYALDVLSMNTGTTSPYGIYTQITTPSGPYLAPYVNTTGAGTAFFANAACGASCATSTRTQHRYITHMYTTTQQLALDNGSPQVTTAMTNANGLSALSFWFTGSGTIETAMIRKTAASPPTVSFVSTTVIKPTVQFGTVAADSTQTIVLNDTTMQVQAPSQTARTVDIKISQADELPVTTPSAYVYAAQPTVTAISPNSGALSGGNTATITGTNFANGMTVSVGGVPASNVQVLSATSATLTVPAHPFGVSHVVVSNNALSAQLSNAYTYTTPAPVLASISPSSGPAAGGTSTTVLTDNLTTNWMAQPLTITNNTATPTAGTKQVAFTLDTASLIAAGKMRSDCADLRIYDADKSTVVPFGILYGCNTANTHLWAQAGVVGGDSTKVLYAAYGNLQTSVSVASGVYDPASKGSVSIAAGTIQSTIGTPTAMATYGKYVFVGGANGFRIYDATTSPLNPTQVFASTANSSIRGIAIKYPYAYIVGASFIEAYNITNMSAPTRVSTTTMSLSTPYGAAIRDNYLFVPMYGNSTLVAYNIYDPSNPTVAGTLSTSAASPNPQSVTLIGTQAVVTNANGSPLIVDATSPVAMSASASLNAPNTGTTNSAAAASGRLLFTVPSANQYLNASSIATTPANSQVLVSTQVWSGSASALYASGPYVYATGSMTGGLQVVSAANLTNPSAIALASSSTLVGSAIAGIGNQYVYAAGANGLTGFRMSVSTEWGAETVISNTSAQSVRFGGVVAQALTQNGTTLTATTPARPAGSVSTILTRADGQTATVADSYVYTAAPTLASISPSSGPSTGGDTITLTGTSFATGAQVAFGSGVYVNATYVNGTTLTVPAPATPASMQNVTVRNSDGQTAVLSPGYRFIDPTPTVSAVTPSSGPTKGGTSISMIATNLSTGWSARPIKITNASATAYASTFQASFTLDTASLIAAGKMRSDCADLRLFDTNKSSILPYGIVDGCNTSLTQIWVQVGAVAANSSKTVYAAYGNGSVTTSAANGTFNAANSQHSSGAPTSFTTPYAVNATESYGSYIYAASANGVLVYDASTATPNLVQTAGSGNINALSIRYPYMYVTNTTDGTIVSYNIRDPANPLQEARITVSSIISGVAIGTGGASNYLYATTSSYQSSSIYVYDITNPSGPTLARQISLGTGNTPGRVTVANNTLYVPFAAGSVIYQYSLANPSNPTYASAQGVPSGTYGDYAVQGKYLYLLSSTYVYIYDVSSASSFVQKGSISLNTTNGSAIKLSGPYAYIGYHTGSTSGSVSRYDITNSAAPAYVSATGGASRAALLAVINGRTSYAFGGAGYTNAYSVPWLNAIDIGAEEYFSQTFPPTALSLGGTPTTGYSFNGSTNTVTATSGARSSGGLVDAQLTRSDGVVGSTANAFTYLPPPGPTSISPQSGLKTGGDTVTITGIGFTNGATVKVGSSSFITPLSVNSTTIIFTMPAHPTGTTDITVKNGDGQLGTLSPGYTYKDPPITVGGVSPNHGTSAGGTSTTMTITNAGSGWTARPLTVTNASSTVRTSQQVSFSLDTASLIAAGKMRSDCADLRVFGSDQSTLLPYGIGSGCNTTSTLIWAEVPTIPANGSTVIYPSYNNPEAKTSAANGTLNTAAKGQLTAQAQFTGLSNAGYFAGWADTNGSYIYSVNQNGSFLSYPVSQTAPPTQTNPASNQAMGSGAGKGVKVNGNYAYALATGALRIYDIGTSPTSPTSVATITGLSTNTDYVTAYNGYIYIANYVDGQVLVYDATIPASPTYVRTITITSPDTLIVEGDKLYVNTVAGASIYSLANPANPTLQKSFSYGSNAIGFDVQGTYLYVGLTNGPFVIYDVSSPANPNQLSSTTMPMGNGTYINGLNVSGPYAYAGVPTSGTQGQVFIYNVVDPVNPANVIATPGVNQVVPNNILTPIDNGRLIYSHSTVGQSIITGNWQQLYYTLQSEVTFTRSVAPTAIFGGTPATTNTLSGSTLTSVTPAHAPGQVDLIIKRDDDSTATASNAYLFDYPPTIASLSPSSGGYVGGDTVTITGSYFTSATQVKFGFDGTYSTPTFVNGTTLRVVVPAGAVGQVDMYVRNADGQTGQLVDGYTYRSAAPTLTSISPSSGSVNGNATVTLTGSNFFAGGIYRTKLTLNNTNASTQNDVTVPITFDTTDMIGQGKMQADGSDMRFYNADGQSNLPFWVESGMNSEATKVWVRLPSLPPGQRTIYVSYGNSSLTNASNQNAAFRNALSSVLVGYWPMDETTTGTLNDASQGTSLSPGGDVNTTVGGGRYGNARVYNGANAYNNIASTTTVRQAQTGVTFETWVNTTTNSKSQYIMSNAALSNGAVMSMNMNLNSANCSTTTLVCFGVWLNGTLRSVSFVSSSLPANAWNHLVGTFDGATLRVYLNGAVMSSASFTGTLSSAYTLCLGMPSANGAGACTSQTANGLSGSLDDVRMYSRGLTTTEVSDLYSAKSFTLSGTPNTLFIGNATMDGSVGVVQGDELTYAPTVTFDGRPATVLGAASATTLQVATPAHAAGKVDVVLTSVEGQSSTLSQAYTYAAAAGPTLTSVSPAIGPTAGGVMTTLTGTGFYDKGTYRQPVTITNADATTKTAYQVPVTIDTASLIAAGKMQADGRDIRVTDSDGTTSLSYFIKDNTIDTPATVIWAKVPYITSGTKQIYVNYGNASAATASSSADTFVRTVNGLQASYALDDADPYSDFSGNGYTLNEPVSGQSSTSVPGKFGQARQFTGSGISNYLRASSGTALNATNNSMSAEAWFRPGDVSQGNQTIVSAMNGNGTAGYQFTMNYTLTGSGSCTTANYFCFSFYTNSGNRSVGIPSSTLKVGSWYHAVGTFDGSTIKLYLNGALAASFSYSGSVISVPGPICLGGFPSTGSTTVCNLRPYKGAIDEVRLYNRAITAAEVSDLFGGAVAPGGQTGVALIRKRTGNVTQTTAAEALYGTSVTFGGTPMSVSSVTGTTIAGPSPAHGYGRANVVVQNPDGQTASLMDSYRYAVYKYRIIAAPSSLRQEEPAAVTVQAEDQFGNPITLTDDVTLTLSSSTNTGFFARSLTPSAGQWDFNTVIMPRGSSQVTFYYKNTARGTHTVTARGPTADGSIAATASFAVKSKYSLLVTGVSNPIKSGVPSSVTVQAVDYKGEALEDYTGSIQFTSGDGGAALPASYTFKATDRGGKTFTNGVTFITEGTWCVNAVDANDADIKGGQCGIVVDAPSNGTISRLRFITAPQNVAAASSSGVITVQTQDAGANAVPVKNADKTLYIYGSGGNSSSAEYSLDGVTWSSTLPQTLTVKKNTSSASFYYRNAQTGVTTLTARDEQGTGADIGWRNATQAIAVGPGGAARIGFTMPAATTYAGQSQRMHVSIQDIVGNNLAISSDQVVYITTGSDSAQLSATDMYNGAGNTLRLTIPGGQAGVDFWYKDAFSGIRALTASDTSPPNGNDGWIDTTEQYEIAAGQPTSMAFISPVRSVIAGDVSEAVTVQLKDSFGNPAVSDTDTVMNVVSNSPATKLYADLADTSAAITSVTVPAGQSNASFVFKQTAWAGSIGLTASSAGLSNGAQTQLIERGTTTKLSAEAPQATGVAGQPLGPIAIRMHNQFGIAVPPREPTTLTFAYTSASASVSKLQSPWSPQRELTVGTNDVETTLFYNDTKAGAATLTIRDDAGDDDTGLTNASLAVTVNPGPASRLGFDTAPQQLLAGQPSNQIRVAVQDEYGNAVPSGSDRTVELSSTSQHLFFDTATNGSFDGSVTRVTLPASTGEATFYYKGRVAETATLTASTSGYDAADQSAVISWGDINKLGIDAPANTAAGMASDAVTIRPQNAYGIDLTMAADQIVALTSSSSTGRFDTSRAGSFDGSVRYVMLRAGTNQATVFYRAITAGTDTLTANLPGDVAGTADIVVVPGAATQVGFTSDARTLALGEYGAITVSLLDAYENPTPVTGANRRINLATNSAKGVFRVDNTSVSFVTLAEGTSSQRLSYADTAVGQPTITAASTGVDSGSQQQTVTYGESTGILMSTPTPRFKAGTTSGAISLQPVNAYGAPVPASSAFRADLTSSTGTGRFATSASGPFDTSSVALDQGATSVTVYYTDTTGGQLTLSATDTAATLTSGTLVMNVAGGDAALLRFVTPERATEAGQASQDIVVGLRDIYGNVTTAAVDTLVNASSSAGTGKLSSPGSTTDGNPFSRTIPAGASDIAFQLRDTKAGVSTLTADSSGLESTTQTTTIAPGRLQYVRVVSDEQTIEVNAVSSAITLKGYDMYDNETPITREISGAGGTVAKVDRSFELSSSSSTGTFSLAGDPFSSVTDMTVPYGASSATVYYRDTQVGDAVLTLRTTDDIRPTATQTVRVTPGPAAQLKFTTPYQVLVKNTASKEITVALSDRYGFTTTTDDDVVVSLTSNSPTGQFSRDGRSSWTSAQTLTYAAGESEHTIYYRDSSQGTFTMNAAAADLTSADQTVQIVPGDISSLVIRGEGSTTAGVSMPTRIETQTMDGLSAAVSEAVTIPLSSTAAGQFSLSAESFEPIESVVIEKGQYYTDLFYRNIVAGIDTITASTPDATGWSPGSTTVDVGGGSFVAYGVVAGEPFDAGGQASITLQARDQYGNATRPATDQTAYVTSKFGAFSLTPDGPRTIRQVTIPADTGITQVYYSTTVAGTNYIMLSDQLGRSAGANVPDTGITDGGAYQIVASPPATQMRFTTEPQTINAGQQSPTITVELMQADGSPAYAKSGTTITARSVNRTGTIEAVVAKTLTVPAGESSVSFTYRSGKAGTDTIQVERPGIENISQPIIVKELAPSRLRFLSAQQIKNAGAPSDQMRVQLQDAYGNPSSSSQDFVVNLRSEANAVTFSAEAGGSAMTAMTIPAGSTDLYFYGTSIRYGEWTLFAESQALSGIEAASQSYFTRAGAAVKLLFLPQTINAEVGQTTSVRVQVSDQFGNEVNVTSPLHVFIKSSSSDRRMVIPGAGTNGRAAHEMLINAGSSSGNFSYVDYEPGDHTIEAQDIVSDTDSDDQGLANARMTAAIRAGVPDHLKLSGTTSTKVGQEAPMNVTVYNRYDVKTPLSDDTAIRLSSGDSTMQFATDAGMNSTFTSRTLPAGTSEFDFFYRTTRSGQPTLAAFMDKPAGSTIDILSDNVRLTIQAGDIAKIGFLTAASTMQAGQPSALQIMQTQDIYGNQVLTAADLTVYLSSSDPKTVVASDQAFKNELRSVVIRSGTSNAGFYFKHFTPGTQTITAADAETDTPDLGLVNGLLESTVSLGAARQLAWRDVPAQAEAGEAIKLRVQSQNQYGVPVPVSVDHELQLYARLDGSGYAPSAAGPWHTRRIQLPANQSETTVYYRGVNAGVDILRVADRSFAGALSEASASVTIGPGAPSQIAITTEPFEVDARHTSPVITAEIRNKFGGVSPVVQDTDMYLRSDSIGGQFTDNPLETWGVNYLTLQAGESHLDFYYHDSVVGTPTITVSDNLPLEPDVDLTNATQQQRIGRQTLDHLDVTNISTPQVQGTPSSVVVRAEDSEGYVVSDYAGTISFSSPTDPTARLPKQYTFKPGIDKGIHTFTNGVTFARTGFMIVTAQDINVASINGSQVQIEVISIPDDVAGFRVEAPTTVTAGQEFEATITAIDADGNAVDAYDGIKTIDFANPGDAPRGDTPVYPEFISFSSGVARNVKMTLFKAEEVQSLRAAQGTSVVGESDAIIVLPAAATVYEATAPLVVRAGEPFDMHLKALDEYGNTATQYVGSKAVIFQGPGTSSKGDAPAYPGAVRFTDGEGDARVTLFKKEITTITARDATIEGTTGRITVEADDDGVRRIEAVEGNGQKALVNQLLAVQPKVRVLDMYDNPVADQSIDFIITAGNGEVSNASVVTDANGQAAVTWRVGPEAGTDNNKLEARSVDTDGSPVVFTATAHTKGFVVSVPEPVIAGIPFNASISAQFSDGSIMADYTGTKTIVFSGPSSGPNGTRPVYPAELTFVNGIAEIDDPSLITLFAAETTTLTVFQEADDMIGTSPPFTVRVGPPGKLAITTPPQQLENGAASQPITVCAQDTSGNSIIADTDILVSLGRSSNTGQFASSPDDPWNATQIAIEKGMNCATFFYRDTTPGTHALSLTSGNLIPAEQPVNIKAVAAIRTPQPPKDDAAAPVPTPAPAPAERSIAVYQSSPTISTTTPRNETPVAIELPPVIFPTITSPRSGSFLTPIDNNIIVTGTAPPSTVIRLRTTANGIVGAATSDSRGNWQANISMVQFSTGDRHHIYAELATGDVRTRSVSFVIKQSTLWERIINWFNISNQ